MTSICSAASSNMSSHHFSRFQNAYMLPQMRKQCDSLAVESENSDTSTCSPLRQMRSAFGIIG